jgi:molybdopterin/thiamine biosynthesis adenylyltransferase
LKTWFELDPERYAVETHFWSERGFAAHRDGDDLVFRGTVSIKVKTGPGEPWEKHRFELTVTYRDGFPYLAPEVAFIDPSIRHFRHQSAAGKPCLFPEDVWHTDRPTHEFLGAIEAWLRAYVTGTFPRELALYELPSYFKSSGLAILGPPGMDAAADGRDAGRFHLTELTGLDLAVVTQVDKADIGTAVLKSFTTRRVVKQQARVGRWYRLDREPEPTQSVEELQAVLLDSGHGKVLLPRRESPQLTALVFDDDVFHEQRWLFLDTGIATRKATRRRKDNRPLPRPAQQVLCAHYYPVSHKDLFRRLEGVRDIKMLRERIVTVFGLGAIGSHATLALAREGVGEFKLCDPDYLKPGNVVRHALDLSDAGRNKAEAVEGAVHRINPYVETKAFQTGLRAPEMMEALMAYSHLVISAIGDDKVEEQLNAVAVTSPSTPTVLYVRTLHGGDALRIFRCRPGEACFMCLELYQEGGHPNWVTIPGSDLPPIYDEGCAGPSLVGAGLTSQLAGIFTARKGLDILTLNEGRDNHWLWLDTDIPGIEATRTPEPGVLHADRFERHPDCPVCPSV